MNKSSFALNSLIVVAVFYLLAVGEALLLPFVIAVALWYLINTLSNAIERLSLFGLRVKPILARIAALLAFISMIWALVKFFGGRVDQVLEIFPLYQANLIARWRGFSWSLGVVDIFIEFYPHRRFDNRNYFSSSHCFSAI